MPKKHRNYSVFVKRDGEWLRLSPWVMSLEHARHHWQDLLLSGTFEGHEMSLRPAEPLSREEVENFVVPTL